MVSAVRGRAGGHCPWRYLCILNSSNKQIRKGVHILGESTIDEDSSIPKLGPNARSGRELKREGGILPEQVDEGRNVILITFPLANYSGWRVRERKF